MTSPLSSAVIVRGFAVVLGCCALASFSTAQNAQDEEPPAVPATPVPPEIAPIEEQKLNQFAEAFLAIEEIHTQVAEELDEVETTADAVKAKAEQRVIQAVERSGLELDEFNQIAERTAMDVELRARIVKKLEERRRI